MADSARPVGTCDEWPGPVRAAKNSLVQAHMAKGQQVDIRIMSSRFLQRGGPGACCPLLCRGHKPGGDACQTQVPGMLSGAAMRRSVACTAHACARRSRTSEAKSGARHAQHARAQMLSCKPRSNACILRNVVGLLLVPLAHRAFYKLIVTVCTRLGRSSEVQDVTRFAAVAYSMY